MNDNDFLNRTLFAIPEKASLVVIDCYDLYKERPIPSFGDYPDVIFMVDRKTDCEALEESRECFILVVEKTDHSV